MTECRPEEIYSETHNHCTIHSTPLLILHSFCNTAALVYSIRLYSSASGFCVASLACALGYLWPRGFIFLDIYFPLNRTTLFGGNSDTARNGMNDCLGLGHTNDRTRGIYTIAAPLAHYNYVRTRRRLLLPQNIYLYRRTRSDFTGRGACNEW